MTKFTTFTVLAVSLVALVPSGIATWGGYGSSEPNTHFDALDGFMFANAPGATSNQVYFNMFMGEEGGPSPNSAMLESRVSTVGPGSFSGFLGVWADCNHDGYIGMADGGLYEYRAEVSAASGKLVDTVLCPAMDDTAANAGLIHNGGGWITELIPIAPRNDTVQATSTNWRVIFDSTAAVWGDRGQPVTPTTAPGTGCTQASVTPVFGHGATGTTGGMLKQIDCDESVLGPISFDGAYTAAKAVDPTGAVGLLPKPSTTWGPGGILNVTTFGTDQSCKGGEPQPCASSNSYVYGQQDCSATPVFDGHSTYPVFATAAGSAPVKTGLQNSSTNSTSIRPPGTLRTNSQGTIAATVNETVEENPALDDCNSSNDRGNDVYGNYPVESATDSGGSLANGKVASDMYFTFSGQPRGSCAQRTVWQTATSSLTSPPADPIPGDPTVPTPSCGQPNTRGVTPDSVILTSDLWRMGFNYVNTAPAAGGVRANTASPADSAPDFAPGAWYTFYAHIGATGVSLPHSGGDGTYGTEWCTGGIGAGAGNQNGWECDPAKWNLDPASGKVKDNAPTLGTVGEGYQLRDVDCYDTTLVGASASPTHQDVGPRVLTQITYPGRGCS